MKGMNSIKLQQIQEQAGRKSLLQLVLKAAFIALVGFGAPAGVLAAIFPRVLFGLTAGIACPRGSEMQFDEWYDGEGTQFRVYCIDGSGQQVRDRTLLALGVLLGAFFLAIFYIALVVLLIQRMRNRRKYGVDTWAD